MSHYIRCARETGQVLDPTPQENTTHPMNNYVLWVEVALLPEGTTPPWLPRGEDDQVFFKADVPVNPDVEKVILKENQGQWMHTLDPNEQAQRERALRNAAIEAEFQRRLELWCALEPEGHQMRFILAGIEDKNHPRYLAYLSALEDIRAQVTAEQ